MCAVLNFAGGLKASYILVVEFSGITVLTGRGEYVRKASERAPAEKRKALGDSH